MQKLALLVLCGGILLSGCQSSSTAPVEVGKTPDSATAEKPKEPEAATTASEPEPATAANIAEIPEKFKTDAYVYGGLEKLGQQTFSQTITGQEPSEAVVTTTYLGIKDGFPQFERVRSGAMSAMGTDTVRLTEKGVDIVSMSLGKISGDTLELPASLEIGKSWTSKNVVTTESDKIDQSSTYKVVGMESVTVPAGKFEALKITMTGTLNSTTLEGKINATYWYAKNVGTVKTTITQQAKGASSPVSLTIELKK